ncbi:sulfite reductase subunit alpha [Bosea sp. SSUT16]|jgi:sulfite reductase (NADPH) flavoprotein alpha-component|uniref:assimilatory sulfite reductase (NADPH) n=1 Tax=Bosea spartocytisi TaxID=2773451 RepID=A0A927E429_9HYPH|nr:sulfite reductase subunit alpha [Bosea spartocytisi]MBD3844431.1 sulfite reductase subunit alpha [Bosea spartocytisi]MCT4470463.1 sulfite reductase subunit alpha [Bosea spartocytisi]
MTVQTPTPLAQIVPESAPFSEEQRSWLNGFFAGLLSLDNAGVTALSPAQNAAMMEQAEDDGAPWHDPSMPMTERLQLAEGKPLPRRLYAAMAQQDCGQCGYVCETYSAAIASGAEGRLNLCAPGGKETLRQVKALMEEPGASAPAAPIEAAPAAELGPKGRCRENPALATFLSRRKLNGAGSEKETWHVEFDLSESGLDYVVGDAFGIVARNDPRLVDAVIALLGARPDAEIGGKPLRDRLMEDCALGPAPDALFQLISYVTGGEARAKARRLAAGEDPDGDIDRLDVLGTLHKFSQARLSAEAFVEALDPLQPRLYSISSSHNATPGRITLTVDTVRYKIGTRPRWGVASTFLAERVEPGDKVPVYVQRAHGFGLPADPATPIIMCGPGTGVAPFRAFLHDRQATKAPGRNWLFFGHQRRACDFFYEDELQAMKEAGILTNLTLAWSRDAGEKVYVQDRMRERGGEVWAWLEQGAHFYVCGDAKRMAKDVERALVDVVAEHGGRSSEEAIAYVASLRKAGRYQADVY